MTIWSGGKAPLTGAVARRDSGRKTCLSAGRGAKLIKLYIGVAGLCNLGQSLGGPTAPRFVDTLEGDL